MIVTLVLVTVLATALWWARHRLVRVRVVGPSMLPTLNDGDVVLARRTNDRSLRVGQIVVAETLSHTILWDEPTRNPRLSSDQTWMVKRIAAIHPDDGRAQGDRDLLPTLPPGTVFLLGDNRDASSDSRDLGPWPVDRLLGVMVCRLRRAAAPRGACPHQGGET